MNKIKKGKEIILLDPLNKNTSHVYFNASILIGLLDCNMAVSCILKKSHLDQLKRIIDHKKITTIKKESFFLGCVSAIFNLLRKSSFRRNHIILLSYDNTIVPLLLIFFYPILSSNKLSLITHNNLQTITSNLIKKRIHIFLIKLYKATPIVLTKYMHEKYKSNFNNINVILFIHPNYKNILDFEKNNNLLRNNRLTIAVIGRQAKLLKGFIEGLDFSRWENIDFIVSLKEIDRNTKNNLLVFKERLSFDDYYSILSFSDFCLFANDESVLNRASGILIDCISLGCPIISSNQGHFEEFSELNIGFNYTNYDEILSIFDKIQSHNYKRDNFKKSFIKAQEYSTFDKNIFI